MAYTNSSLIKHTYYSPNHYSGRNCIDGVTVHCVVGHGSWSNVGEWFSRPSTNASCNYFVDDKGEVTLIVDEKNGSWCTSSYNNDMRKITIEVASDTSDPYAFTEAAYNGVIKLVADIYKRNKLGEAKWVNDAAHPGNITVHRWFKNKACPGDWFMGKLNSGDFCKKVNAIINGKPAEEKPKEYQAASIAKNDFGIKYSAHVQTYGDLKEVHDGMIAGTLGMSKRLESLTIKCPDGMKVSAKVHMQGIGWRSYSAAQTLKIGTTGESRRIEGLELNFEGVPAGKKVRYQVHCQTLGWMSATDNGYFTGTVNQSKRIEAIKIWVE